MGVIRDPSEIRAAWFVGVSADVSKVIDRAWEDDDLYSYIHCVVSGTIAGNDGQSSILVQTVGLSGTELLRR
jgi:hypothetical protein